jgi:hypothetical protein
MSNLLKILFLVACICLAGEAFSQENRPEYVSMLSLISTPERYEGKIIKVRGYFFHSSPSQNLLFNNSEDTRGGIDKNSLWIYGFPEDIPIPKEYVENAGKRPSFPDAHAKHVTVVGRFRRYMKFKTTSMPTGIVETFFIENIYDPKKVNRPSQP